jgi:hypothetical protein
MSNVGLSTSTPTTLSVTQRLAALGSRRTSESEQQMSPAVSYSRQVSI